MNTVMRYRNVQGLRGIAALSVVIGHANSIGLVAVPPWLAVCGYSGVDVFFAISGFIICQSQLGDATGANDRKGALPFLVKRYWRIYPLYWVALAFVAIVSIWAPLQPPFIACDQGVSRYISLTTMNNCFIPPAWTLQFELYFYTIFAALMLLAPRNFYLVIGLLMVAQVVVVAAAGSAFDNSSFLSSPLILEFGAGCGVAWIIQSGFSRLAVPSLICGVTIFACGPLYALHADPTPLPRLLSFGVGGTIILYALLALELNGRFVLPTSTQKLGNASYSLYLWHWPLVTLFAKFAAGWVGILAVVILSFGSHYFLEVPLSHALKRVRFSVPRRRMGTKETLRLSHSCVAERDGGAPG
jgi:exopolysaccharide production protein ExoZ